MVALVVVAVLALVFGVRQCGHKQGTSTTNNAASASGHGKATTVGAASQRIDDVPVWLAQAGVRPRKIAGKVLFEGKPVEGAVVRLALAVNFNILQQLEEVKTGPDGSFDFGPQAASRFDVSAESPGKKPAHLEIITADPTAKPDQLVLELGACGSRLYGSVLDASGGAIAKARLRVAGLAGGESDDKGEYSVCVETSSGPPNQIVRVEADGYGTIQVIIDLNGELRYDFVLVPEAVLVGQVVTTEKKPVAGARVVALPDPSEGPHHIASGWAISDEDGRFRVPGLSPGHYRLLAKAEGYASTTPVEAILQAGTAQKEVVLVVSATAKVTGHVVMADKPVAGAAVVVFLGAGIGITAGAVSQDDGSFTLQGVPMGKVKLNVQPYEVVAPKELDVNAPTVDNVKVEVAALAAIHGKITRKGQPVKDGTISGPSIPEGTVRAKSDGTYEVKGLKPGPQTFFGSSEDEKAFAVPEKVVVAAGEDKLVDIDLDFAGRVKGVVVDESGKPVPSVYVRMINNDGDMGQSMTNVRGEFDAGSMSGGDYRAAVYPSPMAGQPFEPVAGDELMIKVPPDGVVTNVKIAIKYETFTISGNIVDDAGGPVADVHIEAIGRGRPGVDLPSIMSAGDGTFMIRNLARGTYSLHAHAFDGSEGDALNIAAGAQGVTIKLMRAGAVDGTLVGFTTTPQVRMRTLTTDLAIGGNPIVEGTHFYQTGLRPGKYAIETFGTPESAGASIEIKSGETTKVTLTSRGEGKVEGHLYELGTKTPLPGYRCDANLSMGGEMGGPPSADSHSSFPDAQGHFAMAAPVGTVRVFCFPQGGGATTVAGADVEVTKGNPASVDVYGVRITGARGDAGIRIKPVTLPLVIVAVTPNSAAAQQGIKPGDHIVSVDGASLQGVLPAGASVLIANHKPGTIVTVGIDRGGTVTAFKLPVVASPD